MLQLSSNQQYLGEKELFTRINFERCVQIAEEVGLLADPSEKLAWKHKLTKQIQEPIVQLALNSLASQLSQDCCYHDYAHTAHQVLPISVLLAHKLGLSERDTHLVALAAAWHDLGFIQRPDGIGHEVIGAQMMFSEMQLGRGSDGKLGRVHYSVDEVFKCLQAVLDTKLVENHEGAYNQNPVSDLGRIICTADLISFARPFGEFFSGSLAVFMERTGKALFSVEQLSADPDGKTFLLNSMKLFNYHRWLLSVDSTTNPSGAERSKEIRSILEQKMSQNMAILTEQIMQQPLFNATELEATRPAVQRLRLLMQQGFANVAQGTEAAAA
jgi:hypothetical protein